MSDEAKIWMFIIVILLGVVLIGGWTNKECHDGQVPEKVIQVQYTNDRWGGITTYYTTDQGHRDHQDGYILVEDIVKYPNCN